MEKFEILFQIFIAFTIARLMGRLFIKLNLPSVAGELLAGAILGPHLLHLIEPGEIFEALAELGVILLLFNAGLETHIKELYEVKGPAVAVAVLGVIAPFVLGYAGGLLFGYNSIENMFIGTAMVATSVGITIRVLQELGYSRRISAKIILGAAVLDDVLGLIVLVIVKNLAFGQLNPTELIVLIVEAFAFVGGIAFIGPRLVKKRRTFFSQFSCDFIFEFAIILMLALSLFAEYIGLAAIVGAFMAGLMLSEFREFTTIEDRFATISWFFVPFFFVLMGTYIDFSSFTSPVVLLETALFTAIALASKYFGAYLGALKKGKQVAREVGVGMIPRGEVGIVVAGIALSYGVIEGDVYTSVIGMVVLTTVVAPFLIKLVYERKEA